MAQVTLTPVNYWQANYGSITAQNPTKKRLTYGEDEYLNQIAKKRAVFLEFSVPSNAAYAHAVIDTNKLTINCAAGNYFFNGFKVTSDLNLSIGKSVSYAGYPKLYNGNCNVAEVAETPALGVYNGKIYIGIITAYNNPLNPSYDYEFESASLDLDYTVGTFAVTPSVTGGYLKAGVSNTITVSANYIADMLYQYSIASGNFYYKKSSDANYTRIALTDGAVTLPANTLSPNETYNIYVDAVSDDGQTATSSVYTVSTSDVVGTVTALTPNNVVRYGSADFTWDYDNSLGNPQKAYDLQVSSDQVTWTDIASHTVSENTYNTSAVAISGTVYWRVRSYNQDDTASAWSNVLSFENVLPPNPPTITSITGTGRLTVSWNATDQIAYQVMIGDYDSGWVYSTAKSFFLNEYLSNGGYEIKVRVAASNGLISGWATQTYTQNITATAPTATIEMQEGYNEITISAGTFDKFYIIRNGVVIAETSAGTYNDYFCNGADEYIIRGVYADDTFADLPLTGAYTCNKPAVITPEGQIYYVNERLDEQPQIGSSKTLDMVAVNYLGRTKPVHHVGQLMTRTWTVTCAEDIDVGRICFYRNFRGDKAWIICSNVQSSLNWFGVHEYQFTLEETDYSEAVEYAV